MGQITSVMTWLTCSVLTLSILMITIILNIIFLILFDRKRKRRGEKESKGLRHFSMKVCEKVQRKGVTSYNEVADELVREFSNPPTHHHHHISEQVRSYIYGRGKGRGDLL